MSHYIKSFLILGLVLLNISLYAQKEDNIWLYGQESYDIVIPSRALDTTRGACNIDFNFDPPKLYYDPKRFLDFVDSNSSVCDADGNVLASTNGMVIYNQYDMAIADTINYGEDWEYGKIDYNGVIIPGGKLGIQTSLFLPSGIKDRYYAIYTTRDRSNIFYNHFQLSYALFEVGEDNKDGKLISKDNVVLMDSLSGSISAVRHGNGRDCWLVAPRRNGVEVNVFLVNAEGITFKYRYDTGFDPLLPEGGIGQVYFSPDGKWLAWFSGGLFTIDGALIVISEFDRCDGTISNSVSQPVDLSNFRVGAGISFSASSRYLYMCNRDFIYQYDLDERVILSTETKVATYDGYKYYFPYDTISPLGYPVNFCYLGLAPDGRIYVSPSSAGTRLMSIIAFPDEQGMSCDVRQHSVFMPTGISRGIPNFPNYRLGPLDGSPCDTLGLDNHPIAKYRYEGADTIDFRHIRFTDLSYFRPTKWVWDFGDGTGPLEQQSPYHRFARNGTYNVCLTVSNEYSSNTTCRLITLGTTSTTDDTRPPAEISVFPNPATDYFNLTLGDYVPARGTLTLYALSGVAVHTQRVYYGQNAVNVTDLPSGMYVYRLTDEGQLIGEGNVLIR